MTVTAVHRLAARPPWGGDISGRIGVRRSVVLKPSRLDDAGSTVNG
jgi:hypothetical protein